MSDQPTSTAGEPPVDAVSQHPDSKPVVRVYVRKGAHNEQRIISFGRPTDLSARELLQRGIAIDGTQASFGVTGEKVKDGMIYYGPFIGDREDALRRLSWADCGPRSLPDAIADAESALVDFLDAHGCDVEFA